MRSRAEQLRRGLAAAVAAVGLALAAPPAHACPGCAAARSARTEIFGDGFFRNLAIAVLPFLIIGAVCLHVQNSGRWR